MKKILLCTISAFLLALMFNPKPLRACTYAVTTVVYPADEEQNVPLNSRIWIRDLQGDLLSSEKVTIENASGQEIDFSYQAVSFTPTLQILTPTESLQVSTEYSILVDGQVYTVFETGTETDNIAPEVNHLELTNLNYFADPSNDSCESNSSSRTSITIDRDVTEDYGLISFAFAYPEDEFAFDVDAHLDYGLRVYESNTTYTLGMMYVDGSANTSCLYSVNFTSLSGDQDQTQTLNREFELVDCDYSILNSTSFVPTSGSDNEQDNGNDTETEQGTDSENDTPTSVDLSGCSLNTTEEAKGNFPLVIFGFAFLFLFYKKRSVKN